MSKTHNPPKGEVAIEHAPVAPPSFPVPLAQPKGIALPQMGGSYMRDDATGEVVRLEHTKLPGETE